MKKRFLWTAAFLLILGSGLFAWNLNDQVEMESAWISLAGTVANAGQYEPAMVANLPEPARRYFNFSIKPGTMLKDVAEISMHGQFSLGTKEAPDYQPMVACQILAPAHGFVWKVSIGEGLSRINGSDAAVWDTSWTRFWISDWIPVARISGSKDHARSAFGRYIAEALFWTPAALLPSPDVTWAPVGKNTTQVTVRRNNFEQTIELTVDPTGRPIQVAFQRWSDANPDNTYRLQPFGGYLSEFRDIDGYRIPMVVTAGNHFGTDAYFAFYKAHVREVRFLQDPMDARMCGAGNLHQ